MRPWLLFTVAVLLPSAAAAQDAPPAGAAADTQEQSSSDDSAGEIIVTAAKREQRLQDVPAVIAVTTGAQLEAQGITNLTELTRVTPGLVFNRNGAFAQPTIRGIGTRSTSVGDSSSVATYIDGVYLSDQRGGFSDFNNIERVEVLKGPQGTLFGRNATGGAISIVTRDPTQDFQFDGSLAYGSYNRITAKAYATGGVTDNLAADVSLFFDRDDGFVRDIVTGQRYRDMDNWGARSKLRWDPSDQLALTLSGDYAVYKTNAGYAYTVLNRNVANAAIAVFGQRRGDVAQSFLSEFEAKQTGANLKAVYTGDALSLTSITAYRRVWGAATADLDAINLNRIRYFLNQPVKTFTQELYINTRGTGMFSLTAGLFALWEQGERTPTRTTSTNAAGVSTVTQTVVNAHTFAFAPYAELTTSLSEKFDIITGLRYSYERRELKNYSNGVPRVNTSADFRHLDYRATAQYKLNRDFMVYATMSTGFKSGVFNTSDFSGQPVRPEKVKAYQLGLKSNAGPVKISGDLFYYDYRDIQVTLSIDPRTGVAGLQNAARAHIKGAEIAAQTVKFAGFSANLGASYLDAKYVSFPGAQIVVPNVGGGNRNSTMDASGQPVIRSPKLTLNAGLTYETPFAGGELTLSGSIYHSSSFNYEPSGRVKQPAYELIQSSIGWSPDSGRFTVTAYCDNCTNQVYFENLTINTTGDLAVYMPPRRFGVRVNVSF